MAGGGVSVPEVGEQATGFAQRIETLLQNVLGECPDGYVSDPEGIPLRGGRTGYKIMQRAERGIPLDSDGEAVASLSFRYICSCKADGEWLQIDKSVIMITAEPDRLPIFHYDYNRVRTSETPGAHINISGSNDAATRIMLSPAGEALEAKVDAKNTSTKVPSQHSPPSTFPWEATDSGQGLKMSCKWPSTNSTSTPPTNGNNTSKPAEKNTGPDN